MRHKTDKRIWYCDNCDGSYVCEVCHPQLLAAAVQAEREVILAIIAGGDRPWQELADIIRARTAQGER